MCHPPPVAPFACWNRPARAQLADSCKNLAGGKEEAEETLRKLTATTSAELERRDEELTTAKVQRRGSRHGEKEGGGEGGAQLRRRTCDHVYASETAYFFEA